LSWAEFLLFVHLLSAILWLGGSSMLLLLGLTLRNADAQRRVDFTRMTEKGPSILFAVTSIVVIVAGTLMVSEYNYDYSDTWLTLGYVGWFISFLFGVGFYGPEGKRREKVIEADGLESPAVTKSLNRVLTVAAVDTTVIALVVLDMATKPGL
jgi:putative copper export protein